MSEGNGRCGNRRRADLIPGKAEAFFRRYGLEGVHCYPDHKSMMEQEKLDAVCVCTYNTTHAECTIDALEKGIHVILEKPMCVTQKEAEDIIRAEKKSGSPHAGLPAPSG